MALQKQNVPLSFAQGIDTKTDEFQLPIGKFRVMENAIFKTLGSIRKRDGYQTISSKTIDGTDITSKKKLKAYLEELTVFTNERLYSTSLTLNRWSDKGFIRTAIPTSMPIVRNNRQQSNIDSVSIEGVNIYCWEPDTGGIRYSVVDQSSNTVLVSEQEISATGERPRADQIGNIVYISYIDGNNLKFRKFNVSTPSTLSTESTLRADVDSTDKKLATYSDSGRIFFCYQSNVTDINVFSIDQTDTASTGLGFSTQSASDAIDIKVDSVGRVILTYSDGTYVRYIITNFNITTALLSATNIETGLSSVTNVTSKETDTPGTYRFFYELNAASVKDHRIKKALGDTTGTVSGVSNSLRSVGLQSEAFSYNNTVYVMIGHQSTLQNSYFIIDEDDNIVSKISPNISGQLNTTGILTSVSAIDTHDFLIASQIATRFLSQETSFFSEYGVNSTILDFNIDDPFQSEVLADTLHISGGVMKMYDGAQVVEHGFHLFPEDIAAGSTSTSGGNISDGTYQYAAVYAWRDNKGQLHRSSPSTGLQVILSGATSTQQQDIDIPSLRLTEKTDVKIELYRSEDLGTILYKVGEEFNDPTVDTITVTDTISDTSLISQEILYTEGSVLENIAPPSSKVIATSNERLFLAGLENENKIQYSKISEDGFPVEFNDTQTILVDPTGGPITALQFLDEKLIIFKENSLYAMSGTGPTNSGQLDDFTQPEKITSDVGCTEINSIVVMPRGLMFKSKKGIYLLDRSLSIVFIGASVEDFNSNRISSAKVVAETNQVRFTTDDGPALIYDYLVGQWSTFTNFEGPSSEVIGTDYFLLKSTDEIVQETEGEFKDSGTSIKLRLETGWISFAGIQGFQRVYQALLLGKYKSPHKLRIKAGYDFVEAFTHEKIIDTADFTDNTKYGEGSPYGTDSPYGAENQYQVELKFKKQKCQSIKIGIEDLQNDEIGEGMSLSAITFKVGTKSGLFKVDSGKSYGLSSDEA